MKNRYSLCLCLPVLFASMASAATVYSESASGDISGNRNAPTVRNLVVGSNDLFATTQGGDQEYLTLIVPAGVALRNLILRSDSPASFDQTAFMGMAAGSPFPMDPASSSDISGMLGWTHFSPGNVGGDLFTPMRTSGAQGFGSQLPAGTYSFVIQQLGTAVTYQMDFVTVAVPEPTTALVVGAGVSVLALRRRRRCV